MDQHNELVSLRALALALRVPAKWLESEVAAGRIPVLRAGRRRLFNVEAVRETLLQMAREPRREGGGR